jgi:hypothetical protein
MPIASYADVPGLAAWYDGTQGFTVVGGFVTAWADQSGNNRTIIIAAVNKPKWNGTDALLMLQNLADGAVNIPITVSINSQSFTLLMTLDFQSSRGGVPAVAATNAVAVFSAKDDISAGMASDYTSAISCRGFANAATTIISNTTGNHQGLQIYGLAGGAGQRRIFSGEQVNAIATPFTANTTAGMNIGGTAWNNNVVGRIQEIVLYSHDLTAQETTDVLTLMRSRHGLPVTKSYILAVDGDSLTYGTGLENTTLLNPITQFPVSVYAGGRIYNFAVPGQTATQMLSGIASVTAAYDASAGKNVICVYNADISHAADWQSYLSTLKTQGWKVICGTTIAGNFGGSFDVDRLPYNANIRSTFRTFASDMSDQGGDIRLSDYNDPIYYQTDKIHLTGLGYAVVKDHQYNCVIPQLATAGVTFGVAGDGTITATIATGATFTGFQTVTLAADAGTLTATAAGGTISGNGTATVTVTPVKGATTFAAIPSETATVTPTNGQQWGNVSPFEVTVEPTPPEPTADCSCAPGMTLNQKLDAIYCVLYENASDPTDQLACRCAPGFTLNQKLDAIYCQLYQTT